MHYQNSVKTLNGGRIHSFYFLPGKLNSILCTVQTVIDNPKQYFMKTIVSFLFSFLMLNAVSANVMIKHFEVSARENKVSISWKIDAVTSAVLATLERSADGINYFPIKSFELKTESVNDDSYTDTRLNPGTYYYRLHLTKPRYVPTLSKVITVKIDARRAGEFQVTNPVIANIRIAGKFPRGVLVLEITSMNGIKKLSREITASNEELLNLPVSSMDKGWYIVRVIEKNTASVVLVQTIFKQ